MRAVVFINYEEVPGGAGHVGWGFETQPGTFCYGAKEAVGTIAVISGQYNGVFIEEGSEQQMLNAMKTGNHGGNRFPYDAYKYVEVAHPNPQEGLNLAHQSPNWGYALVGNNCMDDVFRIIKAYASNDDNVLPWPATHWLPVQFFDAIPTPKHTF